MPRQPRRPSYAKLKAEAESKVVRWQWASGPLHDPRPYWAERLRIQRGKPLAKAPALKTVAYRYGFDAADRLVVALRTTEFKDQVYDEFFFHDGDTTTGYDFDSYDKTSFARVEIQLQGDKPMSHTRSGKGWTLRETYHYEDDRLARIETFASRGTPQTQAYFLDWDADTGALRSIATFGSKGTRYLVYEAPRRGGPPLKTLASALEELLVERLPRVIAAARIQETAYCVALVYDEEGSPLPPELGVGLERQRQGWAREHGKETRSYVWSPEDYELFDRDELQVTDREVRDRSRAVLRALEEKGSVEPALALLARVAARLNKLDWSALLPITSDFVVCPVSLGGGVRKKDQSIALPSRRRAALQRKGYL